MTRKERYDYILNYFRAQAPVVTTELEFGSAFQLLVATLLSAQCTDKRINQITPELFKHYPTPQAMAKAEVEEVFEYIKTVSYPNAKAKHLVQMARMLVEVFGGEMPSTTEELTGRRTQDGKRVAGGVVQQTHHGCRYPCVSSKPSFGTGQ